MAIRQRAKFEGWLKFELAYEASREEEVNNILVVESGYEGQQIRGDLYFRRNNKEYIVELKTPNTNWRVVMFLKIRLVQSQKTFPVLLPMDGKVSVAPPWWNNCLCFISGPS